jgi:hypothetical protein
MRWCADAPRSPPARPQAFLGTAMKNGAASWTKVLRHLAAQIEGAALAEGLAGDNYALPVPPTAPAPQRRRGAPTRAGRAGGRPARTRRQSCAR